jgi:multimeric flavodoxin WrbA
MAAAPIRYLALNCSLKAGDEPSSTDALLDHICKLADAEGAVGDRVRVRDAQVAFGVSADEGEGDGWPAIRRQVLAADVLILATPIWLGHPTSVSQMVLERLDAFLGETDDRGQMSTVDRVALVAVVGNEDGAHHVGAELFQGLNDVGFTIPAGGMTYWVGEAMQTTDFKDLDPAPEKTIETARTMVRNGLHLAQTLRERRYPQLERAS